MGTDKKGDAKDDIGVTTAQSVSSTFDYHGYSVLDANPLEVETWRLPESLAWIRSITKSFARSDREQFVRDARQGGEGAFHLDGPRSGDIRLEGRLLLDRAALGHIAFYAPGGMVLSHYLGPSALILPRGATFAIWPWQHAKYDEHLVDVWCKRQDVQRLWRAPEATTIGNETKCQHWLEGMMRASPLAPDRSKVQYRAEAIQMFPRLPVRGFERAWLAAIKATGAIAWSLPGRRANRTDKADIGN